MKVLAFLVAARRVERPMQLSRQILNLFPVPIRVHRRFASPLFIQPTAIGSEYEDCTSFHLFGREVGPHKFYLIGPYIGHKPLLSRMNIVVSTIKHLFKILILHWDRLLSIKLISLHAFGLQAFRPTTHILLHMFLLGLPLVNTVWPSHFLGCFYGYQHLEGVLWPSTELAALI